MRTAKPLNRWLRWTGERTEIQATSNRFNSTLPFLYSTKNLSLIFTYKLCSWKVFYSRRTLPQFHGGDADGSAAAGCWQELFVFTLRNAAETGNDAWPCAIGVNGKIERIYEEEQGESLKWTEKATSTPSADWHLPPHFAMLFSVDTVIFAFSSNTFGREFLQWIGCDIN